MKKGKKILMMVAASAALLFATFTFGRDFYEKEIKPTDEIVLMMNDDDLITYYGGELDEVVVTAYK